MSTNVKRKHIYPRIVPILVNVTVNAGVAGGTELEIPVRLSDIRQRATVGFVSNALATVALRIGGSFDREIQKLSIAGIRLQTVPTVSIKDVRVDGDSLGVGLWTSSADTIIGATALTVANIAGDIAPVVVLEALQQAITPETWNFQQVLTITIRATALTAGSSFAIMIALWITPRPELV